MRHYNGEYNAPKQTNYSYQELMDIKQFGLYIYEDGFKILRHGEIKAHNGVIAQVR